VRVRILDAQLEPLPAGVAGELFVGGPGVARGYVNRPEETAERFAELDGERSYRTGDLARFLPDGSIEFLGRVDEQVKIRGFRVEPGEIEAALAAHPDVRDAAVVARADGHGDPRLVAYVVASPKPSPSELQAFLAESLPDFMIPSLYEQIDMLPLTPSGKTDRRALPEPGAGRGGIDYVEPRDELEAELAGIWQELLGVERVGAFDDFFALGGHSLLATQAIIRIRREHGDIPLGALFAAPTVAALAQTIRAAQP
jgi:acyl-CoA synthetase (AMP-forming)/AMP-acid ligase II